jgi:hypothetical protein
MSDPYGTPEAQPGPAAGEGRAAANGGQGEARPEVSGLTTNVGAESGQPHMAAEALQPSVLMVLP